MSDIEGYSHARWVPIPLDQEADAVHDALVKRFGPSAEDSASAMTGVVRQLQQANAATADDGLINLAAWALVAEPGVLDVQAFATLRAIGITDDLTQAESVEAVVADAVLFQAPVVETMETMSGDATSLRFRPMDGDEVHQIMAVLWTRPASNALYVLSSYSTDLVEAAEVGDLLDELGAGIGGL